MKEVVQQNHLEKEGLIHGLTMSTELAGRSLRLNSHKKSLPHSKLRSYSAAKTEHSIFFNTISITASEAIKQ